MAVRKTILELFYLVATFDNGALMATCIGLSLMRHRFSCMHQVSAGKESITEAMDCFNCYCTLNVMITQ